MEEIKNFLLEYGYNDKDAEKILNSYSLHNFKFETLLNNINDITKLLSNLGYSKNDIIKIIKAFPAIYGLSIENIKQKIDDLTDLGYSKADIIKMTKLQPSLYCYSIENIKQKIDDMIILGYSKTDVIKMTKTLPALYCYSIENIKQKIEFYQLIGINSVITEKSKHLMQSVKVSYARYMFYKNNGIKINVENYNKLFIGQKQFENSYRVSKEELLQMYDYDEFIKEKNNVRII